MNTNMMELNMNEMAAVAAGEMTREERQEALAAKKELQTLRSARFTPDGQV